MVKPKETPDIWEAVVADPAIGVCIIDLDGKLLFSNQRTADLFVGKSPSDVVGRSIYSLLPHPWAEERMEILHRIMEQGRPVILRHILQGRQLQSNIRPLETPEGEPQRFLVLTHEGTHDGSVEREEYELIESDFADFGPLDVLTRRELEVLALIKHGLRLDDIARTLHRSPKTIQSHRDSIARKLKESNRVKLAEIARTAGLELRDAGLERI